MAKKDNSGKAGVNSLGTAISKFGELLDLEQKILLHKQQALLELSQTFLGTSASSGLSAEAASLLEMLSDNVNESMRNITQTSVLIREFAATTNISRPALPAHVEKAQNQLPAKAGRGRKKKAESTETPNVAEASAEATPKRAGRPRKTENAATPVKSAVVTEKRKPGRPKSDKPAVAKPAGKKGRPRKVNAEATETVKKSVGRPRKEKAPVEKRKPGRPASAKPAKPQVEKAAPAKKGRKPVKPFIMIRERLTRLLQNTIPGRTTHPYANKLADLMIYLYQNPGTKGEKIQQDLNYKAITFGNYVKSLKEIEFAGLTGGRRSSEYALFDKGREAVDTLLAKVK